MSTVALQYSSTRPLPRNWRERMPDPSAYYKARLASLSGNNSSGWAQADCPFHEDSNASLSVQITHPRAVLGAASSAVEVISSVST